MTEFIPLKRMQERIFLDKNDSNAAYFTSLLYGYELVVKFVVSAFVASIGDDSDRHRYRLEYQLVRASGIGEWVSVLNDVFAGPASAHLDLRAKKHREEISGKVDESDWRFCATKLLREALIQINAEIEPQPKRSQLLQWFRDFSVLRNKTRGHGAISQAHLDNACEPLAQSLTLVIDNLALFSEPWAFIRRNMSNKYRVCKIGADDSPFAHLRSDKDLNYEDGIYIAMDMLRHCRLIHSDQDLSDFCIANGGFTDQKFEMLSYITGQVYYAPSSTYLRPAEQLPGSVTEGKGRLEITGNSFTNLPLKQSDYVERGDLQKQLRDELLSTMSHPIVTLDGRGGIGKTSTALYVITELAKQSGCPYSIILWFSARDIDLMPEGAKLVRPAGVTIDDFAIQFANLLELPGANERKFDARAALANALSEKSPDPTLFIFDNFETVVSPAEAFTWLDTYVRPPNKVLITTRIRGNFKADFPIHVSGMTEPECKTLISATAQRIGISGLMDEAFVTNLINESEGHPYIVKVLLGEVARSPSTRKVSRVMASRDDILDALFERTFDAMSPVARRVFLTLAGWKSVVPELAVEAVLIRPGNEQMDIPQAIQELLNSSLVDEIVASHDEYFLSVPLAAQVFGQKKLQSSPYRGSIAEDIKLLQQFGAAQRHDVGQGLEKRLVILFRNIAAVVKAREKTVDDFLPIIEYIARKMPKAWLYLADLCDGCMADSDTYVRNCLVHYLERDGKDDYKSWKRVADLFAKAKMPHEEINAIVSLSKARDVPTSFISNATNRVNSLMRSMAPTFDHTDRFQLVKELAKAFDSRRADCNSTDLSRLAWLYLSLQERDKAREIVTFGLQKEPENEHCLNLWASMEKNNE
jgi:hypothetical protein